MQVKSQLSQIAEKEYYLGCNAFDIVLTSLIVLSFCFLADWRRNHSGFSKWIEPDEIHQLGAEYDTIARSVRSGRGFSDPFHTQTGPTAWMPPALVYITASLYYVTGDNRDRVLQTVVIATSIIVWWSSLMFIGYSRMKGIPVVGYILLIVGTFADFHEVFQKTHDTWLLLLLVNLMWLGFQQGCKERKNIEWLAFKWGLFGGVIAMASPVLAFVWATASSIYNWCINKSKCASSAQCSILAAKYLSISLIAALLVMSPWMVRNRILLGKWIPIKSNAIYEIWQCQVFDDDGILDIKNSIKHPWSQDGPQRKKYIQLGEVEFNNSLLAPVYNSIIENPLEAARRIFNRFLVATIFYTPLDSADEIIAWKMRLIRLYFPLPFVSLILLLTWKKTSWSIPQMTSASIYAFYLIPYILVSYYPRYAAPLLFIKMFLILHASEIVISYCRAKNHACN